MSDASADPAEPADPGNDPDSPVPPVPPAPPEPPVPPVASVPPVPPDPPEPPVPPVPSVPAVPPGGDSEDMVRLTDPRAIRALAHPARLAVLDALTDGRTLTATEAADIAGLSPSAMSYHLRALAKWGIVRPADTDATSDGRERRWKRGGRGLMMDSLQPGAESATAMIAGRYLDVTREKAIEFLQRSSRETKFWQENSTISHSESWMTEEEARELNLMSHKLMERFRLANRRDSVRPPGTRRVRTTFVLVPIDAPPSDEADPGDPAGSAAENPLPPSS